MTNSRDRDEARRDPPEGRSRDDDVEREAPPPDRDPEPRRAPREDDVEREQPVREREREVERERPAPDRDAVGGGSTERVVERERTVERVPAASGTAESGTATVEDDRHAIVWRVMQGVDYVFFLLYTLLLLRFVLAMVGAGEGSAFVRFIFGLTEPFYAPFEGIVSRPALDGGYLDFPLAIALIAYVFLHLAIKGLIRVIVGPRPVA